MKSDSVKVNREQAAAQITDNQILKAHFITDTTNIKKIIEIL